VRRRLVAVVVVLLVLGGAVAVVLSHSPGNVSHPQLSFTQPTVTATTTTHVTTPAVVDDFEWPRYGYDAARTRAFTGYSNLHPPFHVSWKFGGNALIEFPPVIFGHTLFFMDDGATVKAVNTVTGHQLWATHVGTLSAASPALALRERLVIVPTLSDSANAGQTPGNGEIAALSMLTGRIVWTKPLPSGSESSPLVWNTTVYFGDQAGTVYSMNAATGHVNWTYQASGPVKGGVALSGGIIYFGDYDGRAYAVNAATGHQVWAVSTNGASFGRVYMGNTDGRVYSFAARTGQLAWATSTGAYVYASASVADIPGLGPTVYLGSYDGNFYAFNAQSGAIRWSHAAGGRISGSSTIVNGIVYYSDLGSRTTTGLNARTGAVEFTFPDGAFTPIIADDGGLYLSGYDVLYQLLPDSTAPASETGTSTLSATSPTASTTAGHVQPSKGPARRH
jgi:outer membrane protein assembly factor BamB